MANRTAPFANNITKGAWGESMVTADLLFRGHEVFRAVSYSASCDLIGIVDSRLMRIEVRCAVLVPPRKVQIGVNLADDKWPKFDTLAIVLPSGVVHYVPALDGIETLEFSSKSILRLLS